MKLFLSISQLDELKGRQIVRLAKWCNEHGYFVWKPDDTGELKKHLCDLEHLPQLSLGQLIEFLDEHKSFTGEDDGVEFNCIEWDPRDNLIDILWEYAKELLSDTEQFYSVN